MWIDRKTYDDLRLDNAKLATELRVLLDEHRTLQATFGWMTHRVTQLEKERATMIERYTGVKIEAPVMSVAPKTATQGPESFLHASHLGDPGDEMAAIWGAAWDADGRVVYGGKKN